MTNRDWMLAAPFIPPAKRGGRRRTTDMREVVNLASLIISVHEALAGLGALGVKDAAQKTPVVSARASVKPDYLVCMECGRKQKTLKRHLATSHSMSPEQYRADFGLSQDYPMTAPNYSERRRDMAKAIGLGRKRGPRKAAVQLVPATTKLLRVAVGAKGRIRGRQSPPVRKGDNRQLCGAKW